MFFATNIWYGYSPDELHRQRYLWVLTTYVLEQNNNLSQILIIGYGAKETLNHSILIVHQIALCLACLVKISADDILICVEVLQPSQPNRVMPSEVSYLTTL